MPKNKYTQRQQAKFISSLAKNLAERGKLSKEIYDKFKITNKTSKKDMARNYAVLFSNITLDNPNFILVNHLNMIRYQSYLQIQGDLLAETKFGFWKSQKGNGEYFIIEDILEATERTGNPSEDINNISGSPEVENLLLMFSENRAADIPKNADIEKWATLEGGTNWVNERINKLKTALDYPLSTYLKNMINGYSGYTDIVIDSTGLTDEQKQTALQRAIGKIILFITNDYRNTYNESIDGGTTPNFTYKMALDNLGLIFDTDAEINNEIDYLRKLYKDITPGANGTNYPKDWGVGEIINMDLTNDREVILLPGGETPKFQWNAQFGQGTTPLWFALKELVTEYVFWGSIFTKSIPGLTFSFAPETKLKDRIISQAKAHVETIDSVVASINEMEEPLGFKDFKRKKADILKMLKEEKAKIVGEDGKVLEDYIKAKQDATIIYKGEDLLLEKDLSKPEDLAAELKDIVINGLENLKLRQENLELKIAMANDKAETKELEAEKEKVDAEIKEAKAKEESKDEPKEEAKK